MKLLIILICLASERYLVHKAAEHRWRLFSDYIDWVLKYLPLNMKGFNNAYVLLVLLVLPLLCLTGIILALFGNVLFGFIGFILELLIFYFCLGPQNVFYPLSAPEKEEASGRYFVAVNQELFAPIFWFMFFGPLAVLAYRLISVCCKKEMIATAAEQVLNYLDWITARLTVLLYLLVGNFQKGFHVFRKMFFSLPENNAELLQEGGRLAAESKEGELVSLPHAQILVEHALVVYLVFLAFFTLAAWL